MTIQSRYIPVIAFALSTFTLTTAHAINPQQEINAASWNYLCADDPGNAGPVSRGCLVRCNAGSKLAQCITILNATGFEQQAGVAMLQAGQYGVIYVKKLVTTASSALSGPTINNSLGTTKLVCGLYDVTGKLIVPAFFTGTGVNDIAGHYGTVTSSAVDPSTLQVSTISNSGNPKEVDAGATSSGSAALFATNKVPVGMPYYEICIGWSNPSGTIAQYAAITSSPTITW